MFEKEAEEYADKKICQEYNDGCMGFYKCKEDCERYHNTQKYWRDGANFGYNKANEWHDINELEPSKEQLGKQLLIRIESVIGDTDYDYLVYKYKGESISDIAGVVAWKEIK